jgi:hypothetical protein
LGAAGGGGGDDEKEKDDYDDAASSSRFPLGDHGGICRSSSPGKILLPEIAAM